jgi:hypothetical protein
MPILLSEHVENTDSKREPDLRLFIASALTQQYSAFVGRMDMHMPLCMRLSSCMDGYRLLSVV